MKKINIEIKARYDNLDFVKKVLKNKNAVFRGRDVQRDTYFNTFNGRLKIRKGNIENCLVYYSRENQAGAKRSDVILFESADIMTLKLILTKALGIKSEVVKDREIYWSGNIKIHLDYLSIGNFVEIEAIAKDDSDVPGLCNKVKELMKDFDIKEEDLIASSYSDLLK